MVDPVAPKAASAIDRRIAPVAPVSALAPAQATTQASAVRADPMTLQALAQPLTEAPPVDVDRVAKIKKAIQDGNFPLVPSTIADRMLALKLEWNPHDKA